MFDNFVKYARRITPVNDESSFTWQKKPWSALSKQLQNVKTDARVHLAGKVRADRIFIRSSLPN